MNKAAATKWILVVSLAGATFLTGCARQYTMTLENGTQMTVIGKPKPVNGCYVAKDAMGQPVSIPMTRVREIAPTSMASPRNSSGFSAQPMK